MAAAAGAGEGWKSETLTALCLLFLPSLGDLFIGNTGGCIGEVSALALLVGLIILLCSKVITWHIPVSILATVAALTGIMWLIDRKSVV